MLRTAPAAPSELPEAIATTRRVARTFSLSTRFLPDGVRADVYLLYLVCRTLDDLVDDGHGAARERIDRVRRWAAGSPAEGREASILAWIAARYPMFPRDAVADLCAGLEQDLDWVQPQTEADLDLYAYRVAGTVGRMMAHILGTTTPDARAAAEALGIAMQRTNILRDIDEDLARGRIYVPVETLRLAGVADLGADDRRMLLAVEIGIADEWYRRALPSTRLLRRGARPVRAAGLMYREILRQIERDGMGSRRPWRSRVSRRRRAALMLAALLHR